MRQKATVYLEAREYDKLCKGAEVELALTNGHSIALALDATVLAALGTTKRLASVGAQTVLNAKHGGRRVVACPRCRKEVARIGLKQHLWRAHTAKGRAVTRRWVRSRPPAKGGAA